MGTRLTLLLVAGLLTGCGGGGGDGAVPASLSPAALQNPTRDQLQAEVCGQPPEFFGEADASTQLYLAPDPNGVTVIYHRGHGEPGNDVAGHIEYLNEWGYSVALMDMPPGPHDAYARLDHGLCRFVSPVFQLVNHLQAQRQRVYMLGISGGGWTTVLAAAMDGRIERSYPVAGGLPYDLRVPSDWGDWEQWHLAEVVGYRDLYGMAEHQLAVQNRYDSCCFAGDGMLSINAGENWSAVVDETHGGHQISGWALHVVVADMLEGG